MDNSCIVEIVADVSDEMKRLHKTESRNEILALWAKNKMKKKKAIGELLDAESKTQGTVPTQIGSPTATPTRSSFNMDVESPLNKKAPSTSQSSSSPKSRETFSTGTAQEFGWTISACPVIHIMMPAVEPLQPMTTWTSIPRNFRDPAPNAYEPLNIPYFDNDVFSAETKLIKDLEEDFAERVNIPQYSEEQNRTFFLTIQKCIEFIDNEEEIFKALNQISPEEGTVEDIKERYANLLALKKVPVMELVPNIDDDSVHTESQARDTALCTFSKLFCRRCLIYDCLVHHDREDFISADFIAKKGNWLLPQEACGPACHWISKSEPGSRSSKSKGSQNIESWKPSDETTFRALKNVYPGNICAIAKIMMKSCNEVYQLSLKDDPKAYVPSMSAVTSYIAKLRKSKRSVYTGTRSQRVGVVWGNLNAEALTERARLVYKPCGHPGIPCGECESCSCREAKTPCEKYCACAADCKHRILGCRCESTCDRKSCPCYAAGRECDPDLCFSCGSSEPDITKVKCKNVPIQRMMKKKLKLAKSDVPNGGWGIFAGERITKNELVSEYVGELITADEADRRALEYIARLHTYLFDLNNEYAIDATYKGSKIRFANHSSTPNTMFKIMKVNTDHRIGIYASRNIEAGEEIFLYYEEVIRAHTSTVAERKANAEKNRKAAMKKPRYSESDIDFD